MVKHLEHRNRDSKRGRLEGGLTREEATRPAEEREFGLGAGLRRFRPMDEDLINSARTVRAKTTPRGRFVVSQMSERD